MPEVLKVDKTPYEAAIWSTDFLRSIAAHFTPYNNNYPNGKLRVEWKRKSSGQREWAGYDIPVIDFKEDQHLRFHIDIESMADTGLAQVGVFHRAELTLKRFFGMNIYYASGTHRAYILVKDGSGTETWGSPLSPLSLGTRYLVDIVIDTSSSELRLKIYDATGTILLWQDALSYISLNDFTVNTVGVKWYDASDGYSCIGNLRSLQYWQWEEPPPPTPSVGIGISSLNKIKVESTPKVESLDNIRVEDLDDLGVEGF